MKRCYEILINDHLNTCRQMVFLSGPRQVGKTTTGKACAPSGEYMIWDRRKDRAVFTAGSDAVADRLGMNSPAQAPSIAIFDELHRYPQWKSLLKGFFDVYGEDCKLIVTGSARMDVYKRGSDSLMGRYFTYRMHPLSVAELSSGQPSLSTFLNTPSVLSEGDFKVLEQFGGYPEPFLRANQRFYNRWRRLRNDQLFHEDVRNLTRIQDIGSMEVMSELITQQAGQLMNLTTYSQRLGVSIDTIKSWYATLESLYYCYSVRPWFKNVAKSLRKQPKVYLWDWSVITDLGQRRENLVASHLLKAVHWWTDAGLGEFGLHFLRDKQKREVDFLVSRDGSPWFMVEVKSSSGGEISSSLAYYGGQLGVEHMFEAVFDLPQADIDCFSYKKPVRVPVTSLLAQLI